MSLPGFLMQPELRLILFGGKGGVGKTACAAAAAVHMAQQEGRSVLLVSTDPAHSLADTLRGSAIPERMEVVELMAEQYLEEFRRKHGQELQEIAERGTFLDREDIERFFALSLPGMDELFGFLEVSRWTESRGEHDTIIVDTAPTGHTLRLLEMPELLRRWVETLDTLLAKHRYMKQLFGRAYLRDRLDVFLDDLGRSIATAEELLRDPRRSRFVPVMSAEELSVRETAKLLAELDRLGIPAGEVVVNKLSLDAFCAVCGQAHGKELELLGRLPERFRGRTLHGVPWYEQEVLGVAGLHRFWDGARELEPKEGGAAGGGGFAAAGLPTHVEDPPPLPPVGLRLLVFAGKGGVGKTTLACATAVRLARERRGGEILLFSTDPAHSLADCLDHDVGPRPVRVMDGLTALEIDAEAELEALKQEYRRELDEFLRSLLRSMDLTFDRQVMERILELSPPGLDEIMALTSAMGFLAERDYSLLILDSAPTGHLIRLLELPEIVDQWLKAFFELILKYKNVFRLPGVSARLVEISKQLNKFRKLLRDPAGASLYAVSILTEVALEETKDLAASCARMQVDMPVIFLNMVTPGSECPICQERYRNEQRIKSEFKQALPGTQQPLVYRQSEPRGLERLTELGEALYVMGRDP